MNGLEQWTDVLLGLKPFDVRPFHFRTVHFDTRPATYDRNPWFETYFCQNFWYSQELWPQLFFDRLRFLPFLHQVWILPFLTLIPSFLVSWSDSLDGHQHRLLYQAWSDLLKYLHRIDQMLVSVMQAFLLYFSRFQLLFPKK